MYSTFRATIELGGANTTGGIAMSDTALTFLPEGMPQLRVVPMPSDANIHGDVFGGWIMAQVDIAGSLPAVRRANGRVATVAVNSFLFKQPVFVGDLLSFYAKVVKVGSTSVTVNVEVYAERMRLQSEVVKVTEATLTYVATGADRKPRALPALPADQRPAPAA
ncbi:MAG: acyl-CoA thioesterase [Burkholderiaceae bacterium]